MGQFIFSLHVFQHTYVTSNFSLVAQICTENYGVRPFNTHAVNRRLKHSQTMRFNEFTYVP